MIGFRALRRNLQRPPGSPMWLVLPAFLLMLAGFGVLSAVAPDVALALGVGWPLGLGLIIWPEVTLGLYANAGFLKADPRLSGLAGLFDLTLALGAVLAVTLAYRLIVRRERIAWSHEMGLVLVFASVILIGLVYTPATSYGTDKAFRFVALTMLAFFTPLVVIRSSRSIWLFFLGWLGFAAWLTVGALGQLGTDQRLAGLSGTAIGMGRTIGVAILILLFAVLMRRGARLWHMPAIAAIALMMLALIGSGSRGPLLVLVAAVALTLGFGMTQPGHRVRSLMIVGVISAVVLSVFASGLVPAASRQRFDQLLNETEVDTSAQARLMVMEVAWRLFTTYPVTGRGTGSVSAFGAGQEQEYPHNILLELAAENGLIGVGLYLTVVGTVLWRLFANLSRQTDRQSLYMTLLAMLLYTFLNAMVSGDLSDNRDMWLFAGVAIAATRIERETAE